MSEPAILFVRPKAIKSADKKALKDVGVIVVEVDDPNAVKFVRAGTEFSELPYGELLAIVAKAVGKSKISMDALGEAMAATLSKRRPSPSDKENAG